MPLMQFSNIIKQSINADVAVLAMCNITSLDPGKRRLMYVTSLKMLINQFGESAAYIALYASATFDMESDNKHLRRGARSLYYRLLNWQNQPKFISELKQKGMAGFLTGELLYVAHICVKPNSKTYQLTTLGKGIGPLGDKQYDSAEAIVDQGIHGGRISPTAKFMTCDDLLDVSQEFQPQ